MLFVWAVRDWSFPRRPAPPASLRCSLRVLLGLQMDELVSWEPGPLLFLPFPPDILSFAEAMGSLHISGKLENPQGDSKKA